MFVENEGTRSVQHLSPGEGRALVRKATAKDVPQLARALAQAFYEDPVMKWMLPDGSQRLRRLERTFDSIFLKRVFLPHEETYTTESITGGALWSPPGKWQLSPLDSLRLLPHMARFWGRNLPRVLRSISYLDSKHPHAPHYYLFILGVEPWSQGKGIGKSLMQPILERCDRERIPAYLEASTPRNRDLYARNGFEIVEEIKLPGGSPPLWRMWRESRA
jgi:N-acetylglutamate synthase-like GNAT family acetyltransferase